MGFSSLPMIEEQDASVLYSQVICYLNTDFITLFFNVEVILDLKKSCKSSTEISQGFLTQIHQFSVFCHVYFILFFFLPSSFSPFSSFPISLPLKPIYLCLLVSTHTCMHMYTYKKALLLTHLSCIHNSPLMRLLYILLSYDHC